MTYPTWMLGCWSLVTLKVLQEPPCVMCPWRCNITTLDGFFTGAGTSMEQLQSSESMVGTGTDPIDTFFEEVSNSMDIACVVSTHVHPCPGLTDP